jgi:hypothetical protein
LNPTSCIKFKTSHKPDSRSKLPKSYRTTKNTKRERERDEKNLQPPTEAAATEAEILSSGREEAKALPPDKTNDKLLKKKKINN